MKLLKTLGWSSALCLSAVVLQAQETSQIEQLRNQLQQMQENFEKVQREQREQIDTLKQQLESLQKNPAPTVADQHKTEMSRRIAAAAQPTDPSSDIEKPSWRPSDPIRIGRGTGFMDIGAVGTIAA